MIKFISNEKKKTPIIMVRDLREIGKKIIFSLLNKHVIITLLFIVKKKEFLFIILFK